MPILVTLEGIVKLVRLEHCLNAHSPMLVTLEGMTVFWHPVISSLVAVAMIALQPFLESYTGLPASTVMLVRPEQSLNAPYELYTIAVTVDGMAKLVRLVQPLNAPSPMNVTPSEMVTLVRPEQPQNE